MNRRRVIFVALILTVVIGSGWIFLRPVEKEPTYAGIPLSEWLERASPQPIPVGSNMFPYSSFTPSSPAIAITTLDGLLQIGTNAIPTLLRMLQAHDSTLKLRLVTLAQKQKIIEVHFIPAEHRRSLARTGFDFLGTNASYAVPDLIQILEHNSHQEVRDLAVQVLGRIGKPAAPAAPAILKYLKTRALESGNDFNFGFSVLMAIDPEYTNQHVSDLVAILNSPYHK